MKVRVIRRNESSLCLLIGQDKDGYKSRCGRVVKAKSLPQAFMTGWNSKVSCDKCSNTKD